MPIASEILRLCESAQYLWQMTPQEVRSAFFRNERPLLPLSWLTDPAFVTRSEEYGCQFRTRGNSPRGKDYLNSLKNKMEQDGFVGAVGLTAEKGGQIGICDGTHRIMLARELGMKDAPIDMTPNFIDNNGLAQVQAYAKKKGLL